MERLFVVETRKKVFGRWSSWTAVDYNSTMELARYYLRLYAMAKETSETDSREKAEWRSFRDKADSAKKGDVLGNRERQWRIV